MKNILVIIADQLSWRALPEYGGIAHTPNISRIAEDGICFDKAYTVCPLCQPARASFWTGVYPHETGVLSNKYDKVVPPNLSTLGETFKNSGYETIHVGKKHDAGGLKGFFCYPENEMEVAGSQAWPVGSDTMHDRYTAVKSVEYLENRQKNKPFFMVTDFVNPHDICSWVGKNKGKHLDIPINDALPELPPNFVFDDINARPDAVKYICCSHIRQAQSSEWDSNNFKHYLAAYYHYIERVDKEIGLVLDALIKSGEYENTMILFMSDHGDSMASHGKVTKDVDFYEETNRVPFIWNIPEFRNQEKKYNGALVSLLDVFPTLCSYAKLNVPNGLRGKDLMSIMNQSAEIDREYVVSEWFTEWGYSISPGRMLRTDHCKYTCYINDGEEFFDLVKDPNELKNEINNPNYHEEIDYMRNLLKKHLMETNDNFNELNWYDYNNDKRWRSHEVGYCMHKGPTVTEYARQNQQN